MIIHILFLRMVIRLLSTRNITRYCSRAFRYFYVGIEGTTLSPYDEYKGNGIEVEEDCLLIWGLLELDLSSLNLSQGMCNLGSVSTALHRRCNTG